MADGESILRGDLGGTVRDGIASLGKDAFLARLHEESPLARDASGTWIASRFEDVRAILLDYEHFSSSAMGGAAMGGAGFPLLTDDPPRHSVLRALLAKAFTPAAMEAMRPDIVRLAQELTAALPAGKEIDIVEALTTPLPVAVIAGMMGVPADRAADFKRWSNAVMGIQEGAFDQSRMPLLMQLGGYFNELAAERRANPGDDLVSALTRVRDSSEQLSDQQVVGFCILLMIAGNETTTNLLGNLLNRLADKPDAWAQLRANPALIEGAIEESLRIDSPAQMVIRRASGDVTVSGQQIRKGDLVMVYIAAANRDPSKWGDASLFAVDRERERHVAFGHGVHTCIGAPLARMEARAVMDALVARFERIERGSQKGSRISGGILFGFSALPLILS